MPTMLGFCHMLFLQSAPSLVATGLPHPLQAHRKLWHILLEHCNAFWHAVCFHTLQWLALTMSIAFEGQDISQHHKQRLLHAHIVLQQRCFGYVSLVHVATQIVSKHLKSPNLTIFSI